MSKKQNKTKEHRLSEEQIELIRVKPEDTAKRLANLPYTITPRPDEKPPRGSFWCPYDGTWNKFIMNHPKVPLSTYPRCKTCGMSIEDYHVKTANKLWGDSIEKQ